MASRSPKDLITSLKAVWETSYVEFLKTYPSDPIPFLTCTYRSPAEQNALYAQGRTKPGKIITNARGGQSKHNFNPSHAFDIAFKDASGDVHWELALFKKFAAIAKSHGAKWGGDWGKFKDNPHFDIL